jgi:type II pantothenate kinase
MDIQEARLLALIEGVLAANIFDWGSRACVDLYHKGTIIEIYRMSRKKMQRPWRASIPSLNFLNVTVALRPLRVIKKKSCAVTNYIINFMYFFLQIDDFDMFKKRMLTDRKDQPYKRALLFVDNSGADVVLGMLPLARELLRHGTEV